MHLRGDAYQCFFDNVTLTSLLFANCAAAQAFSNTSPVHPPQSPKILRININACDNQNNSSDGPIERWTDHDRGIFGRCFHRRANKAVRDGICVLLNFCHLFSAANLT